MNVFKVALSWWDDFEHGCIFNSKANYSVYIAITACVPKLLLWIIPSIHQPSYNSCHNILELYDVLV